MTRATTDLSLALLAMVVLSIGCGRVASDSAARKSDASSATASMAPEVDYMSRIDAHPDLGEGPEQGGDKYDLIVDNPFLSVAQNPLSTFSIDVDTASFSKVRMYLLEQGLLPPADAVRIEELVNYFPYAYAPPDDERPFAAHVEVATCPWKPDHRLVRIGIKGKEIKRTSRPLSNLVFLLDVSGSMGQPNKLPLLKQSLKMLVDQLGENDRVAIVVYAGAAGLILPPTGGDDKPAILAGLERLQAGGSTNGGRGIQLAYQVAKDHFIPGGTNRVILCTDGDFNVGTTSQGELIRLVQQNAQQNVFLTVLAFGMGNHNDAMLEQISNKGNGNYAFIDTIQEARKTLVEQMSGTLVTIAKDVKIQVEFNPAEVTSFRLIGYENRLLNAEDFNDDRKDAGEIGAGHTVTALYELVPFGVESANDAAGVDQLKYQQTPRLSDASWSGELLTLKLRYKEPNGTESSLLTFPIKDARQKLSEASPDFRFAASVAAFGMLLRKSQYKGNATLDSVRQLASDSLGDDASGYRREFVAMVDRARSLSTSAPE